MMRLLAVIAVLFAAAPGGARAEDFAQQVAKAAAAVKDGTKIVVEDAKYPEPEQLFSFYAAAKATSSSVRYTIDLRAHLCFAQGAQGWNSPIAPVRCSAIKKGYPLVAPLITWDD